MTAEKNSEWRFIHVLLKWKKWILVQGLAVGLAASVISLFLPKWYRAESVLAPPKQDLGAFGGFSQILGNLPMGRALGISGLSEEAGLCITLLNSRTLMEGVAQRFGLQALYKKRTLEETVAKLRNRSQFYIDDEGALRIRAVDRDPKRAADLANGFVHFLDSLYNNLSMEKASHNRRFIERRMKENKRSLDSAEAALRVFQQKTNIISLEEQTRVAVEMAGELQAKLLANQLEMGIKMNAFGADHSDVRQMAEENEVIENELKRLQYGGRWMDNGKLIRNTKGKPVVIPLNDIPELALRFLNLYKEVQIQHKLYLFLAQEYEQAKIQEAKDTPTLQVVDKGVPPIKRYKPKRAMVVLSSVLSSTLLFAFLLLFREKQII